MLHRVSIVVLIDFLGGSRNTPTILKSWSDAFRDLQRQMANLRTLENRQNKSILGCILGGSYRTFELQRQHLRYIHEKLYGAVPDED